MKEFIQKNKKIIVIVLIILFILILGGGIYFFFFKGSSTDDTNDNVSETVDESTDEVTPMPEYDERSSSEAITSTYAEASAWASDAKLYSCSGLTSSSVQFPDITYYFLGADEGKYKQWICDYYSKSKGETLIYGYTEGEVDGDIADAMEIGEYGYMTYDTVTYPTDLDSIVDSTVVYTVAIENGMDMESNFCNMYLADTQDYGFVWKVEEKSRTELDEYEIQKIVNSYVVNIYDGSLITKTAESIY